MNELAGMAMQYLIGASVLGAGAPGVVTVVPYDADPVEHGVSVGYCNFFDQRESYNPRTNKGKFGPYLRPDDVAAKYREGKIDPRGPGWERNLREQFERRHRQGFIAVELDNADAYDIGYVLQAIDLAADHRLMVLAKNPLLTNGPKNYLDHWNVWGVIVERDAGRPAQMHSLRTKVGKPDKSVWFVSYGRTGKTWADGIAGEAKGFRNMGVSWSSKGEYENSVQILQPQGGQP